MSILFKPIGTGQLHSGTTSVEGEQGVLQGTHRILVATALMVGGLMLLILSLIAIARTQRMAQIGIPSQLLPGSPLPQNAQCSLPESRYDECQVVVAGKPIHINYDIRTRKIIRVRVQGDGYQLGDLILAWGMPTGLTRFDYGCSVVVIWGTRAAYLYRCVLQLSSHIDLIEYALAQQPRSPWPGWRHPPG